MNSDFHLENLYDIMHQLTVNSFHYKILILCGLGFMADAMEISLLSFVPMCAGEEWNLSDLEIVKMYFNLIYNSSDSKYFV